MTRILGIETSCDETSAAVVVDGRDVLSNVVSSQVDLHARYGGVVPEIASRAHIERIDFIIEQALARSGVGYRDLDALAVADGPGLVGSLLVGVTAAKALALLLDRPLIAVDHIAAHATSAALCSTAPPWPAVALVVSGGHTSLYLVRNPLDIGLLGQTLDDAAGEAFDKVAAILELGFPGGPAIDHIAADGDPRAILFPRTWINAEHHDFSFSGLKTAVLYHVHGAGKKYGGEKNLTLRRKADIAASFQAALVDVLVQKTMTAARQTGMQTVVVGGGVAANSRLRRELVAATAQAGLRLLLTHSELCTDNAAMIAAQAYHQLCAEQVSDLSLEPRSGLRRPARPA